MAAIMISEYTDRRTILRAVGIGVAVSLAGCSESDSAEAPEGSGDSTQTDGGTESLTSDDESSGSGTSEDSTAQTETGQEQQLNEQNESDAEADFETGLSNNYLLGWVEMENPEEQLPEENLDDETYPSLRAITHEEFGTDPYEADEAFYLCFGEEGSQIVTGATNVDRYGENGDLDAWGSTSGGITDQDADIVGILENVVEGYDDVSENMSEEYIEALQS